MNGQRLSDAEIEAIGYLTGTPAAEIRKNLAAGYTPVLSRRPASGGGAERQQEQENSK